MVNSMAMEFNSSRENTKLTQAAFTMVRWKEREKSNGLTEESTMEHSEIIKNTDKEPSSMLMVTNTLETLRRAKWTAMPST